MDKELAYDVNGSVYFRVSKHGKYGSLACLDKGGMQVRRRTAMLSLLPQLLLR